MKVLLKNNIIFKKILIQFIRKKTVQEFVHIQNGKENYINFLISQS